MAWKILKYGTAFIHNTGDSDVPAGEAWVTLVVVTKPVRLPFSWNSLAMESTRFCSSFIAEQFFFFTAAETPIVPRFALTPQRYAVAEQAESAVWWSTQYVWKVRKKIKRESLEKYVVVSNRGVQCHILHLLKQDIHKGSLHTFLCGSFLYKINIWFLQTYW